MKIDFSHKPNTLLPEETAAYLPYPKTLALEWDYSNFLLTSALLLIVLY